MSKTVLDDLLIDAKKTLSAVPNFQSIDTIEPYIEKLLVRWFPVVVKSKQLDLHNMTEEQFEDTKSEILLSVQLAYLQLLETDKV